MDKRYELSDAQWQRICELIPGNVDDPGRTGSDNRLFVNGVLWVLRCGAHWHQLPLTMALLDRLPAHGLFIPCPPVHRGQEVSADAMTHPTCATTPAKAHLLHAQNACLAWLFGVG